MLITQNRFRGRLLGLVCAFCQ